MLVWARTACVPVNETVMNRAKLTVQRCAVQERSLEAGCTLFWYDMLIPSSISVPPLLSQRAMAAEAIAPEKLPAFFPAKRFLY
jgi:hypothetical protein